jgi:hypothetical protein
VAEVLAGKNREGQRFKEDKRGAARLMRSRTRYSRAFSATTRIKIKWQGCSVTSRKRRQLVRPPLRKQMINKK